MTNTKIFVRFLCGVDISVAADIEKETTRPLKDVEIREELKRTEVVGIVASVDGRIVGYCMYSLNKKHLVINRLVVRKLHRRKGAGSALIQWVIEKMKEKSRTYFEMMITDSDLETQMFCRARSIVPVKVVRNNFTEPDEDGYLMRYTIPLDDRET